jgi:hypothetical protein
MRRAPQPRRPGPRDSTAAEPEGGASQLVARFFHSLRGDPLRWFGRLRTELAAAAADRTVSRDLGAVRLDPRHLRVAETPEPARVVIDRPERVVNLAQPEVQVRDLSSELMEVGVGEALELLREPRRSVDCDGDGHGAGGARCRAGLPASTWRGRHPAASSARRDRDRLARRFRHPPPHPQRALPRGEDPRPVRRRSQRRHRPRCHPRARALRVARARRQRRARRADRRLQSLVEEAGPDLFVRPLPVFRKSISTSSLGARFSRLG